MQGVRRVLEELVEVQREYLQGQEEMKKEMSFLQKQVAGAVVVMMEAIAYAQDPEQDAQDYEEWVEGTMGEVLTRELEDLKTEEAAVVELMEVDEEEEVEKEEKKKEGGGNGGGVGRGGVGPIRKPIIKSKKGLVLYNLNFSFFFSYNSKTD